MTRGLTIARDYDATGLVGDKRSQIRMDEDEDEDEDKEHDMTKTERRMESESSR
jgi:hypothetical protein